MNQRLNIRSLSVFLLCCCALFIVVPGYTQQQNDSAPVAKIRALLAKTQPDMQIASIKAGPVKSLYEVQLADGHSIYISDDARFLIPGDLYEAQSDGIVNLGEKHRNQLRKDKIAAVSEKDMIVFGAKGPRKATITVFTDVDCPYCRKLHSEIEQINSLGIEVRYLAYPRTGLKGETYTKMISTWCASDRKAVFTAAKRDEEVPAVSCASPVEAQFALGQEVGVTGTPSIVFEDGTLLPGYVPAATLASYVLGDEAKDGRL
jgi:thiol:disulfide interchange protein DsbC